LVVAFLIVSCFWFRQNDVVVIPLLFFMFRRLHCYSHLFLTFSSYWRSFWLNNCSSPFYWLWRFWCNATCCCPYRRTL
jgi:hypothetical protein